ncbi:Membrane protein [Lysobacter dokdonensis DS-58]|uniref:Membrane protein n=1 Tax=Lysobacter dokdonensis DS-58 TaxID=1300345 RepID=A0A0A2X3C2_9GAMM|nr:hypothetical protein [Lysobacter dokdonensis]KGQ19689.1 Membrane protein [Lysobacter dokdonensis DS-58]
MRTGDRTLLIRLTGFSGALFAACAVALSAYAMHATLQPHAREQLIIATCFAFGHGVALAALARHGAHWVGATALLALLASVVLFAGSLVGAAVAGWPTTFAPLGGMIAIAGWILFALHCLRR